MKPRVTLRVILMKPFIREVNNAILDTFFQCASYITVATAEFIVERKRKTTKIKTSN